MEALKPLNAAFRFGLELLALASLAYWGVKTADGIVLDIVLGLAAPLAFMAVWGSFIAPKAPRRLTDPSRLVLEALLWAAAVAALIVAGAGTAGVALAIAVVASVSLMIVLGQRDPGGI